MPERKNQGHGCKWSYPKGADGPRAKTSSLKAELTTSITAASQGGEAYCTRGRREKHGELPRTRAGRPTELPWCLPARVRKEATASAGAQVSLAPWGLLISTVENE